MTFAGLSQPARTAPTSSPSSMRIATRRCRCPPRPAEAAPAAGDKAAAEAAGAGAQKAGEHTRAHRAAGDQGWPEDSGGEGAAKLTGTEPTAKKN